MTAVAMNVFQVRTRRDSTFFYDDTQGDERTTSGHINPGLPLHVLHTL